MVKVGFSFNPKPYPHKSHLSSTLMRVKLVVILPNLMLDLCREDIRKPLRIHLLDQGEHIGISSVLGPPDLASLYSNGQNGQKANC